MNINGEEIKIFMCASGTGKTTLAKSDEGFIDIDRFKYVYKYPCVSKDISENEIEKIKDKVMQKSKDFPDNFLNFIEKQFNEGKNLLVVPEPLIIDFIREKGWKYVLVYPGSECKEVYRQRLRGRGNSEEFLMWHDMFFDKYLEQYENDKNAFIKIKLKPNEFLIDAINQLKKQ